VSREAQCFAGIREFPCASNAPAWRGTPCKPPRHEDGVCRRVGSHAKSEHDEREPITLRRDCDASRSSGPRCPRRGPSRDHAVARGTYTVTTDHGRCADRAQDVTPGIESAATRALPAPRGAGPRAAVWDQLRTCFDPEIPSTCHSVGVSLRSRAARVTRPRSDDVDSPAGMGRFSRPTQEQDRRRHRASTSSWS